MSIYICYDVLTWYKICATATATATATANYNNNNNNNRKMVTVIAETYLKLKHNPVEVR